MTVDTKDDLLESMREAVLDFDRYTNGEDTLRVTEISAPTAADVRGIREALGLTQKQFADAYGLPIGTVRNWEQGKREPEQTGKILLHLINKHPYSIAREISDLQRMDDVHANGSDMTGRNPTKMAYARANN